MPYQLSAFEIEIFLQTIHQKYGYDFTGYSQKYIERRLRNILNKYQFVTLGECRHKIITDKLFFLSVLNDLTITVTELFRDPVVYHFIKHSLLPEFKKYNKIKIWHAGCATGEEVFSLAIFLIESGLYDKSTIYATDININALNIAKKGIICKESVRKGTINYFQAGGQYTLNKYIKFKKDDLFVNFDFSNIKFAEHNLAGDGCFSDIQLVICRNVLIYFNKKLQNRVLTLFSDCQASGDYLLIGPKETLCFSPIDLHYQKLNPKINVFQKKGVML